MQGVRACVSMCVCVCVVCARCVCKVFGQVAPSNLRSAQKCVPELPFHSTCTRAQNYLTLFSLVQMRTRIYGKCIKVIINALETMNERKKNQKTMEALLRAAKFGRKKKVLSLLDNGVNVDAANSVRLSVFGLLYTVMFGLCMTTF